MPGQRRPPFAQPRQLGESDWRQDAACRDADQSDFYHPDDERGALANRRDLRAKAICGSCPVKAPCLEWALTTPEPYGIWGGLTAEERQRRRWQFGTNH